MSSQYLPYLTIDGPTTLSLIKFSYATTPTLQAKILWTHLPERNDLYAVFEEVNTKQSGGLLQRRKMLRIIQGSNLIVSLLAEISELREA